MRLVGARSRAAVVFSVLVLWTGVPSRPALGAPPARGGTAARLVKGGIAGLRASGFKELKGSVSTTLRGGSCTWAMQASTQAPVITITPGTVASMRDIHVTTDAKGLQLQSGTLTFDKPVTITQISPATAKQFLGISIPKFALKIVNKTGLRIHQLSFTGSVDSQGRPQIQIGGQAHIKGPKIAFRLPSLQRGDLAQILPQADRGALLKQARDLIGAILLDGRANCDITATFDNASGKRREVTALGSVQTSIDQQSRTLSISQANLAVGGLGPRTVTVTGGLQASLGAKSKDGVRTVSVSKADVSVTGLHADTGRAVVVKGDVAGSFSRKGDVSRLAVARSTVSLTGVTKAAMKVGGQFSVAVDRKARQATLASEGKGMTVSGIPVVPDAGLVGSATATLPKRTAKGYQVGLSSTMTATVGRQRFGIASSGTTTLAPADRKLSFSNLTLEVSRGATEKQRQPLLSAQGGGTLQLSPDGKTLNISPRRNGLSVTTFGTSTYTATGFSGSLTIE